MTFDEANDKFKKGLITEGMKAFNVKFDFGICNKCDHSSECLATNSSSVCSCNFFSVSNNTK